MSARDEERFRRLREEEHALWHGITRSVRPLKRAKPERQEAKVPPADAPKAPKPPKPAAPPLAAPIKQNAPLRIAPLERRLVRRLARGAESIDRRLDLHGLTQSQAHDALARFLRAAQAAGAKTVLVVTGKGGRAADADPLAERGVLRRQVPQWLKAREFRDLILGFEEAHIGHGGEGALYVRLRRKGRAH